MFVQITRFKDKNVWYKNKLNQVFEVRESETDDYFCLTKKQLKKLKKARHLEISIRKEDCQTVDSPESARVPLVIETKQQAKDKNEYSLDNIIAHIEEVEQYNKKLSEDYFREHGHEYDWEAETTKERANALERVNEGKKYMDKRR